MANPCRLVVCLVYSYRIYVCRVFFFSFFSFFAGHVYLLGIWSIIWITPDVGEGKLFIRKKRVPRQVVSAKNMISNHSKGKFI